MGGIMNISGIAGGRLIIGGAVAGPRDMIIDEGRIIDIKAAGSLAPGGDILDAKGLFVAPGYIDVHFHGARGADVMDASSASLEEIALYQLEHGTTSYLATTMTAGLPEIQKAIDAVRNHRGPGARLLGVHLEGPFFTAPNAGAQDRERLHAIDDEGLAFLAANKDVIRRVSFSPELERSADLVRLCLTGSISVSAGHDAAIDDEILPLVEAGLECVTHIYCCSSTVGRRKDSRKHLGLTELGLLDDRLFVEVIADRRHTPDLLFDLILKAKSHSRICLVSDSVKYAGLPDGMYPLRGEGEPIIVRKSGDEAVLFPHGPYAGSVTPLDRAVMNIVACNRVALAQAVYMATEVPARLLRLEDRGALRPGALADINILDRDGSIVYTILGGMPA